MSRDRSINSFSRGNGPSFRKDDRDRRKRDSEGWNDCSPILLPPSWEILEVFLPFPTSRASDGLVIGHERVDKICRAEPRYRGVGILGFICYVLVRDRSANFSHGLASVLSRSRGEIESHY